MKMKTVALLVLIAAAVTYGQTPASSKPQSDAQSIAAALSAGPKFVTQNATVLDWPASPGGDYRVLRPGTNGWTCLPGLPKATHPEPGCFDKVFLAFMQDTLAGRTPDVHSVGISYMYEGKWVPNKSRAIASGAEFRVGPHIMIVGLDQKMLQTFNHDGSNGEAYVNTLPGHSELFLVIPIRQWDDGPAAIKSNGNAQK
ncbi:MAG: hypothetical protein WAN72_03315 [Candidatus Acidiferrales bacterium]